MQYSKEVIDARKTYDGLVIEKRELAKELPEVQAKIQQKREGKPLPDKFEVLKKRQAEIEARLADLPMVIADARDALIVALKADAAGKSKQGGDAIEKSLEDMEPAIVQVEKALRVLNDAMQKAAGQVSAVTGEPFSVPIDWLMQEAGKKYMNDRDADFTKRLRNRIELILNQHINNISAQVRSEADRLRFEVSR